MSSIFFGFDHDLSAFEELQIGTQLDKFETQEVITRHVQSRMKEESHLALFERSMIHSMKP